jgi:hypothetical protein
MSRIRDLTATARAMHRTAAARAGDGGRRGAVDPGTVGL